MIIKNYKFVIIVVHFFGQLVKKKKEKNSKYINENFDGSDVITGCLLT